MALDTASFDWNRTQRVLGLSWREVAAMLDTTERSLYRWKAGAVEPNPAHLRRLRALQDLTGLLDRFFGSREEVRSWLAAPVPALGGRPPIELLRRGRVEEVQEVLGRLAYGVYA
ncbi:MAG: antitoxin Xre/MbcA/ParS toxin-binding domain-containing protein [Gemmatimonadota bacterium]